MTRLNVDRMRSYIDRTNAAADAQRVGRLNAAARARGAHCAACEARPEWRGVHLSVERTADAVRRMFGGAS